jgi:DNA-binding CsgD family transcriptional regulator
VLAKHHSTPPASSLRVRDAGEDTYDAPIKLVKRGATVTSAIGRPCQAIVHDRGTWCRDCPTTRAATSRRTCLGIVRIRNAGGAVALWLVAARREVLDLILLGRSPREIAAVLDISHSTAKFHQANALGKLGAESRLDLLRFIS